MCRIGNRQCLVDGGRILQNRPGQDRDGGSRFGWNGAFGCIERNGQPLAIHARKDAGHSGPTDRCKGVSMFRTTEGDQFVPGEVIPNIKIEITTHQQQRICTTVAPYGKGAASHQHILLHRVTNIVGRMVVELTLIGGSNRIKLVRTGLRHGIDFKAILFRYVFAQITVKNGD